MKKPEHNDVIDPLPRSWGPLWLGYAIAIGGTALVFALRLYWDQRFDERAPLILFCIPTILAAWYGGYKPGITALLLGLLLGVFFFMEPKFSLRFADLSTYVLIFAYLTITILVTVAIEKLHGTQRRLEREVEERKNAMAALRESEETFRASFELTTIGKAHADPNTGELTRVNSKFCEITGRTDNELLGKSFLEFTHPEDRAENEAAYRDLVAGKIPFWQLEKRYVRKDGSIIWVDDYVIAFRDSAGRAIRTEAAIQDISARRQAQAAMMQAEGALAQVAEQQKKLSHQLFASQETERRRIARELHDQAGQSLSLVHLHLQALQMSPDNDTIAPQLKECSRIVEQVIEQVQKLSLDLRPTMLDDLGLIPALRWYINQARAIGLNAVFMSQPKEMRLDPILETTCYRIVQEALSNVIRHAKAKWVCVDLRQAKDELLVTISDNGVGFDPAAPRQKGGDNHCLGLLGMEERAALVGGQIKFDSIPHHGTEVHVRFPLQQKELPGKG